MTCLRPCMAAYERDDSQKLSDHVAKQPAAPTKRTLEGSRGSCPPPWSPCSVPRSRSVRRGLLCGRSCPEAPPLRQTRLSPSPPSARDPLSLRRLGDPSRRAPLEALCPCSASTLLTLGHNVSSKEEVDAVMQQARKAGAVIVKDAHDTFWDGYAGYFEAPDRHLWEVLWNPDFELNE